MSDTIKEQLLKQRQLLPHLQYHQSPFSSAQVPITQGKAPPQWLCVLMLVHFQAGQFRSLSVPLPAQLKVRGAFHR